MEEEKKLVALRKKKKAATEAREGTKRQVARCAAANRGAVDNSSSHYFVPVKAAPFGGGRSGAMAPMRRVNGPRPDAVTLFQAGGIVDDATSRSIGRSKGGWGTGKVAAMAASTGHVATRNNRSGDGRVSESSGSGSATTRAPTKASNVPRKPHRQKQQLSEVQLAMVKEAREVFRPGTARGDGGKWPV